MKLLLLAISLSLMSCRAPEKPAVDPPPSDTPETPIDPPAAARAIRITIEPEGDRDHVIVEDSTGALQSESWCFHNTGSYQELASFFGRLQAAIKASNPAAVASLVRFPFRVNGQSAVQIADSAEFVRSYETLFDERVQQAITAAAPTELFCRNGSAMIANGVIWASGVGGVVALDVLNRL